MVLSSPSTQNIAAANRLINHIMPKPKWHPPWKLYRVISGHLGWVRCVTVEPGNEWFATGAADRVIKVIFQNEFHYIYYLFIFNIFFMVLDLGFSLWKIKTFLNWACEYCARITSKS